MKVGRIQPKWKVAGFVVDLFARIGKREEGVRRCGIGDDGATATTWRVAVEAEMDSMGIGECEVIDDVSDVCWQAEERRTWCLRTWT